MEIPYLFKLVSHNNVAKEPMGVSFAPILQPSKCAKISSLEESKSAKSPSITIGKLLITLAPRLEKIPTPKIAKKGESGL